MAPPGGGGSNLVGLSPEQIGKIVSGEQNQEKLRQQGVANIVNSIFKGQDLEAGRTTEARLSKKSDADISRDKDNVLINAFQAGDQSARTSIMDRTEKRLATAETRMKTKSDADVEYNSEMASINRLKANNVFNDDQSKQALRELQGKYYQNLSNFYASGGKKDGAGALAISKEERIKQKDLADTATKVLLNPNSEAIPLMDRWNLASPEASKIFYWDTKLKDEILMVDLPMVEAKNGQRVQLTNKMILDTVAAERTKGNPITPEEVLRDFKAIE